MCDTPPQSLQPEQQPGTTMQPSDHHQDDQWCHPRTLQKETSVPGWANIIETLYISVSHIWGFKDSKPIKPCRTITIHQWFVIIWLWSIFPVTIPSHSNSLYYFGYGVLIGRDPVRGHQSFTKTTLCFKIIVQQSLSPQNSIKNIILYSCDNGVLIGWDPMRGHQSFTKPI